MKLANLVRYTEVIRTLAINVLPTGKDDQVNIQGAVDMLGGLTPEKLAAESIGSVRVVTRSRRRWKWPWDKRTVVDITHKGGTMYLAAGEYIITDTIKQREGMRLEGAIILLDQLRTSDVMGQLDPLFQKALKLGIEALERIRNRRPWGTGWEKVSLPGETKE